MNYYSRHKLILRLYLLEQITETVYDLRKIKPIGRNVFAKSPLHLPILAQTPPPETIDTFAELRTNSGHFKKATQLGVSSYIFWVTVLSLFLAKRFNQAAIVLGIDVHNRAKIKSRHVMANLSLTQPFYLQINDSVFYWSL